MWWLSTSTSLFSACARSSSARSHWNWESGTAPSGPATALQGIAQIAEPVPATSPASVAALLLALSTAGAFVLRRRTFARR